jgi:aminoacrylate hydrolase
MPEAKTRKHHHELDWPNYHTSFPAVHYEMYGSRGPHLLMLHGMMVNSGMFYNMIDHLVDDYRLVLIDNRGFGKSADLAGPFTVRQMARDALHVLDHLGIEDAHVLGYSLGGLIAQTIALERPERVRSLILGVTFAHKVQYPIERVQRRFYPTVMRRLGAQGLARMMDNIVSSTINMSSRDFINLKKMVREGRDDVLLRIGHDLFKFDSRGQLPKLDMPALVVGADEDIVVPYYHSRQLAGLIPGARLKIFEGASHALCFTHAAEFAQLIHQFIERYERQTATA